MAIVAGTGHRPEDISAPEEGVRWMIAHALSKLDIETVISGMAAGFDLWLADEARKQGLEIWAARPWAGHEPRKSDKALYDEIVGYASRVVDVSDADDYPGPKCYYDRNHWMVDNCTHVLAFWSGKEAGGTYQCLKYAKGKKPIKNIYIPF